MYHFDLMPSRRHRGWTHEVERMLENFAEQDTHVPACDVVDTGEAYKISLDIPGFKKENITIEVKDRQLLIYGTRQDAERSEKERLIRQERRFGKFSRTFSLPEGVAESRAEAKFIDGVLEVFLPKTAVETRRIVVG